MLPKRGERYTIEDVQQALVDKLLESETLEYKEDPGGKLETVVAKAVSAFANAGGGNLVLGVAESPSGEPIEPTPPGIPLVVGTVPIAEHVDRLIRTKLVPNPPAKIEAVSIPGKGRIYVIVTVSPRGGGPYRIVQTSDSSLNGRYYARRGRDSVEADHHQLRALFAEAEEGPMRVREYLGRRGLGDETAPSFGQRAPLLHVPTMTWKTVGTPPSREIGPSGMHAVVAVAVPEVLRGPLFDTAGDAARDALNSNNVPELRGFGFRQEPTLDGRWLVQGVPGSALLASYVEVRPVRDPGAASSDDRTLHGGCSGYRTCTSLATWDAMNTSRDGWS